MRYEFSDYVLDTEAHSLSCGGEDQRIEPQVFDLLHLLLINAGALVTRDQLIEEIWNGRIVSDSAISARIAAARRAVGDDGKRQAIIRTVARRGLQFVAPVNAPMAEPESQKPEPDNQSLKIRYATANDGAKLAYSVHGSGTPLMRLLHFPTHLELDWNEPWERSYIDALSQRHTLIRLDERGAGLSEPDISTWDIDRVVEDIKAVVDAAGLDQIALMGSSSGSHSAVCFAAKYPERVSRLVIQSGYVDGRNLREGSQGRDVQDSLLGLLREGWDPNKTAFVAAAISAYMPDAPSDIIGKVAANYQASSTFEAAELARNGVNHHSIAEYLADVRAPTLVMHSRNDAVHPLSEARKMAGGIAKAELVVLESRNHYTMPHEDCWDYFWSELLEFLGRPA